MQFVVISTLDTTEDLVEVVERKGLGHPDTICDALAEALSRNLCREHLRRYGRILHHNVDKALLCGGRAVPANPSRYGGFGDSRLRYTIEDRYDDLVSPTGY